MKKEEKKGGEKLLIKSYRWDNPSEYSPNYISLDLASPELKNGLQLCCPEVNLFEIKTKISNNFSSLKNLLPYFSAIFWLNGTRTTSRTFV